MPVLSDGLRDFVQVENDQMRYSPAAFPLPELREDPNQTARGYVKQSAETGMALCDYFAAHAMQGLLAQGGWVAGRLSEGQTLYHQAYQIAEEMVLERQKR